MSNENSGHGRKPRLILGTMTFGPDQSQGARITDLETYKSILSCFQSAGYTEIDTARVYVGGQQEAFTRAAGWKERGLSCATKWYPYEDDSDKVNVGGAHKANVLEEQLNRSLSELGTDCVDVFYLHRADRGTPFQETLRKLDEMYKKGKFKQLGLSNYSAFELAEIVMLCKANGWVQPTIFQCVYNAVQRNIEPELIPACRRYGLDIVVYNPIAGGLFSGKYTQNQVSNEGRFSDVDKGVGKMYRQRYFKDANFEALRIIEPAAKQHGLTLLEVAFRWLTNHSALNIKDGGNDGLVIGVSSQTQLEQNLTDVEKGPLPENVLSALEEAWLVCKATAASYVHGELAYGYDTKQALQKVA